MSILNRYILKKFVKPFIASFAALCLLIFVSQLFDQLDRFLADGVSFRYVVGFMFTSIPFQALQVLPVACLLGTLFVVGNLSRTREYIAGLAGGLPPERFLSGLFLAGFAISLIGLVANETIIPHITHYARTVYREKIRRLGEWEQTTFSDLYVAGTDGRMWAIRAFNQRTGKMDRVIVDQFGGDQLRKQIDAASAQWTDNGWVFRNGVERIFSDDGVAIASATPFTQRTFGFTERPNDLVIQEPQPEEMTYRELKRHVRHLEALGVVVRPLEVELMMKLAFPFSCFVVTFLGVPLALQGKGSRAMGIAAGGVLTLLYMGFMQFGKAMALRLVPPWFGAWLSNISFAAIGVFLWIRMRRAA